MSEVLSVNLKDPVSDAQAIVPVDVTLGEDVFDQQTALLYRGRMGNEIME